MGSEPCQASLSETCFGDSEVLIPMHNRATNRKKKHRAVASTLFDHMIQFLDEPRREADKLLLFLPCSVAEF